MRVDAIAAVIEHKREQHPELARALTWPGLVRICDREDVSIAFQRIPRDAQLVPFLGRWTILLNKTLHFRRHTYRATHELGHLWLHHDGQHDRRERVFNMDTEWPNDPREDDAELFAQLVLMGPKRSGPWIPPGEAPRPPMRYNPRETPLQRAVRVARKQFRHYPKCDERY